MNTSLETAISWFQRFYHARRIDNPLLLSAAHGVLKTLDERSRKTPHTYAMCILPVLEYLYETQTGSKTDLNDPKIARFLISHQHGLVELVAKYGNQATIPQRALAILSYLERIQVNECSIIEIGASAGILGSVFSHYPRLKQEDYGKYFSGSLRPDQNCSVTYTGFDLVEPNVAMLPYFLANPEHRRNLENVLNDFSLPTIRTDDAFEFIGRHADKNTCILTSFMMYQVEEPLPFQESILELCAETGALWLDMTRCTEATFPLFRGQPVQTGYCYLRKNGRVVAHAVGGSDDMPNLNWIE